MSRCTGAGRPVALRRWRTYYYCPTCGKRLRADEARAVPHTNPQYEYMIVPSHTRKGVRA